MRRLALVLTALTLGSIGLTALPASAASTLVVDDDAMGAPGNCGAVTPTFSSIQAAVTAASPGDTIQVCPGTYTENVTVAKQLFLKGAKAGVDARTRTPSNESIVQAAASSLAVFDLNASGIVLDGFTIRNASNNAGIATHPSESGDQILNNIVTQNTIGLYLQNGGSTLMQVSQNLFSDNNVAGSASGNGIYSDAGAVGVRITTNRFVSNTNAGITFAHQTPPTLVDQHDIVIRGNNAVDNSSFVAMWDVQDVQVVRNKTNDTNNTDDNLQGSAIFVGAYNNNVLIQRNVLKNPAFSGIALRDTDGFGTLVPGSLGDVTVLGNKVVGAENDGLDVTAGGSGIVDARNNTTKNNHNDGIHFGSATNGNLIQTNTALNNVTWDCEDNSSGTGTANTANTWLSDIGVDADPPGICHAP